MPRLKIYSEKTINRLVARREGETKLGEKIGFISALEEMEKSKAEFVLFGVPEDIGVRANHGKRGTANAWEACLISLLNVQENKFLDPHKIIILGKLDCSVEMGKAANLEESDPNYYVKLGELVEQIDKSLSDLVTRIISAGKTPVIIGGGHNNAYGNIKGASEAFGKAVNVLNIDAHTDLRQLEHRHSGNGFSYALQEEYLEKYAVFGLQENYTPQYIFDQMDASEAIKYTLMEDLSKKGIFSSFRDSLEFVNKENFGLELDCDSIANFPSSAQSPSGFSLDEARELIRMTAKEKKCCYLHICEAIAREGFPTGKALSYLVTDFLKEKEHA